MDDVLGIIFLILLVSVSWYFVLNSSARRRQSKPGWELFRLRKEQRETWDAVNRAGFLVLALTSSLILLVVLLTIIAKII